MVGSTAEGQGTLQEALGTAHEPLALCTHKGVIRWANTAFLLSFLGRTELVAHAPEAARREGHQSPVGDSAGTDATPQTGSLHTRLDTIFNEVPSTGLPFEHGPIELVLSLRSVPDVRFRGLFLEVSAPLALEPEWLLFLRTFDEAPEERAIAEGVPDSGITADFLEEVVHDLRNPIGAVFGFADALLETELGAGLQPRQRETVARIRRAAFNANELTQNYQALLRVRSRNFLGTLEISDLNLVARLVEQHLWRGDAETDMLTFALSRDPLLVAAPRLVMERVVSNLLRNALKFTPAGESITLRTQQAGGIAELTVHNTQPVIPKEELEKLCGRYTQGRLLSKSGGLGLGLFIVDQLVTAVGGTLRVESSPEDGTAFTVGVPLAPAGAV